MRRPLAVIAMPRLDLTPITADDADEMAAVLTDERLSGEVVRKSARRAVLHWRSFLH